MVIINLEIENLKDKIENLKLKTLQGFKLSNQEELELILLEGKLKTLEQFTPDKK